MNVDVSSSAAAYIPAGQLPDTVVTLPEPPPLPPPPMRLPQVGSATVPEDIGERYRRDPQFRLQILTLMEQTRVNQPLQFIAQMAERNKQVSKNREYRKFMRSDLLSVWSTHPQLAKTMYAWLPDLYKPKSGIQTLANYRKYRGFRRWHRSQLLRVSQQNPAAFNLILAAMDRQATADAGYQAWLQKDVARMKRNHYGDLAALLERGIPTLYEQPTVVDEAREAPPSTMSVVDAAMGADSACVNCQPYTAPDTTILDAPEEAPVTDPGADMAEAEAFEVDEEMQEAPVPAGMLMGAGAGVLLVAVGAGALLVTLALAMRK